jgi:hypothetical protein
LNRRGAGSAAASHAACDASSCAVDTPKYLADRIEGREIVATLNDFHSRMVEAIFEQGGTLDKFMGDGIMAYFGAPIAQPDHAIGAVRCALRMEEKLAALNAVRAASGSDPLRMGIGIHTGTVLLADIGAPGRRLHGDRRCGQRRSATGASHQGPARDDPDLGRDLPAGRRRDTLAGGCSGGDSRQGGADGVLDAGRGRIMSATELRVTTSGSISCSRTAVSAQRAPR